MHWASSLGSLGSNAVHHWVSLSSSLQRFIGLDVVGDVRFTGRHHRAHLDPTSCNTGCGSNVSQYWSLWAIDALGVIVGLEVT